MPSSATFTHCSGHGRPTDAAAQPAVMARSGPRRANWLPEVAVIEAAVVREALTVSVAAGVPVVLWGSPGTGKTSVVRALGASLGCPVEVVIGSLREPSDFAGLPVVVDGGVRMGGTSLHRWPTGWCTWTGRSMPWPLPTGWPPASRPPYPPHSGSRHRRGCWRRGPPSRRSSRSVPRWCCRSRRWLRRRDAAGPARAAGSTSRSCSPPATPPTSPRTCAPAC
ncbi:MAG: AAA family ATPase [Pseudonocardiaceae bacterium]